MTFEWHIFLWHITLGILLVYMVMSGVLYLMSRQRLFLYYTVYLLLLGIYIFDKNEYNFTLPANAFTRILNWYIQVIYHFIYFWFSFEFVRYFLHKPSHKRGFKLFTVAFLVLGSCVFIYTFVIGSVELFIDYFLHIHVPLVVGGFVFGMWHIIQMNEEMKRFYIPGFGFYMLFSLTALFLSFNREINAPAAPIAYFYLAVIIETTMFSAGLGYYIKRTFDQNLKYQKELNTIQEERKKFLMKELNRQEQDNELIKLKINSMQSQMNSHFIFNTLNSLKTFIIENESETAVNFLQKYAKLMRIYLLGSQQQTQSVEDEINAVKLYVEIENQRLDHGIDFRVLNEESLPLRNFQIPVHVLIPFVEYSIWKGLCNKTEDKHLTIEFKMWKDQLVIDILDNGHYNGFESINGSQHEVINGIRIAEKNIMLYNSIGSSNIQLEMRHNEFGGRTSLVLHSNPTET